MDELKRILGFEVDLNRGEGEINVYKEGELICEGQMEVDESTGKISFDFKGNEECEKRLAQSAKLAELVDRRRNLW